MIIFYNKKTGQIIGTLLGRIHRKDELKMWIGEKKENDRLIVNWKPVRWFNKEGKEVRKDAPDVFRAEFKPDHPQAELFEQLEKNPTKIYEYRVDLKTKKLIKK